MSESLGHQVIIENRPGAGGAIATEYVKNAVPDGYTLLMADSGVYAIAPNVQKNLSYDPLKHFAPVAQVGISPIFLVTNAPQVNTLKDFIALAKAKPGQPYGSGGAGTGHHLSMEMLKAMAGIDLQHIPYKGASQLVPAVIAGDIVGGFGGMNATFPLAKAGKLKILGVTTGQRSALSPETPTIAESGVPGYDMLCNSLGFLAPAKTPPEVVRKLNTEIIKALKAPGTRDKFFAIGVEPVSSSAEQFGKLIATELQECGKLVKLSGLQ
jgi:tripartite-type tricarboxylate transporter receptor subunit TctC